MSSQTSLVAEQVRLRQWATQIQECQSRPADMKVAYGQFWRTAGPHFPASQRHNKRTVKFQAIKPYAAKGALHE